MTKHSQTTITAKHTVRAFVVAMQERNPVRKPSFYNRTSNVIRLESFLGRPALLRDLTDQTLALFFAWLRESTRLSHATIQRSEEAILAIARQAAQMEIIPWPMVHYNDRAVVECAGVAGLLRFFEERFVVDRKQRGKPLAPETVKQYRTAIRSFSRFAPRVCQVHKISRVKINRFRRWLVDRAFTEKKAGNHAFAIAALVKHACPERFVELDNAVPLDGKASRRLAYVFEKYYLPAKQSIASEKTIAKYLAAFNSFGRHLGRIATLDDLTDENVGSYMRACRTDRNNRPRTINGYRCKLCALWTWCAKKRLVELFPTVEEMPEPALTPNSRTFDELVMLMKGCKQMPGTICGISASDWWRMLHVVEWDCHAERTGVAREMRWEWLDWKSGYVTVPPEFRKGGKKIGLYKLKPVTLRELREYARKYRTVEQPLMFPWGRGSFYYHYKRLLRLAGLPYVPYKSGIQLQRRSFATHLECRGGNATGNRSRLG